MGGAVPQSDCSCCVALGALTLTPQTGAPPDTYCLHQCITEAYCLHWCTTQVLLFTPMHHPGPTVYTSPLPNAYFTPVLCVPGSTARHLNPCSSHQLPSSLCPFSDSAFLRFGLSSQTQILPPFPMKSLAMTTPPQPPIKHYISLHPPRCQDARMKLTPYPFSPPNRAWAPPYVSAEPL